MPHKLPALCVVLMLLMLPSCAGDPVVTAELFYNTSINTINDGTRLGVIEPETRVHVIEPIRVVANRWLDAAYSAKAQGNKPGIDAALAAFHEAMVQLQPYVTKVKKEKKAAETRPVGAAVGGVTGLLVLLLTFLAKNSPLIPIVEKVIRGEPLTDEQEAAIAAERVRVNADSLELVEQLKRDGLA